jgi:hypothetical protein
MSSSYLAALQDARGEAIAGSRAPVRPGPGASAAALDEYHRKLADYNFEQQAEQLQRSTQEEANRKRREETEALNRLAAAGRIGDAFMGGGGGAGGAGGARSVLLLEKGETSVVRDTVYYLDGCFDALEGAETFSVLLTRVRGGAGGGGAAAWGIKVATGGPWCDLVAVSEAPVLGPGVAYADPSGSPFRSHALHAPPAAKSGSAAPLSSSLSAPSSSSSAVNAFAKIMPSVKGAGGAGAAAVMSGSAVLGTGVGLKRSRDEDGGIRSLEAGDHIIAVNDVSLADFARPVRSDLERFVAQQRKHQHSVTTQRSPSSSFSSSSSSSSATVESRLSSDALRAFSEEAARSSERGLLLRVRRLTAEGGLYKSHLEGGRPSFLLDAPMQPVREAVVELLRSERSTLKFGEHAKQYMQKVAARINIAALNYAADFFAGRGADIAALFDAPITARVASSSSSSSAPPASHKPHPLVEAIRVETQRLREALTRIPSGGGGSIPDLLIDSFEKKASPHAAAGAGSGGAANGGDIVVDDDDDVVEIIGEARPASRGPVFDL